ncbi:MAG TPA: hypothetical protein PLJ34_10140, partial [Hyphomicrobiales bacterium]|nr:hypothetical protein [Hyphomicrobiales bacterium]
GGAVPAPAGPQGIQDFTFSNVCSAVIRNCPGKRNLPLPPGNQEIRAMTDLMIAMMRTPDVRHRRGS